MLSILMIILLLYTNIPTWESRFLDFLPYQTFLVFFVRKSGFGRERDLEIFFPGMILKDTYNVFHFKLL